MNTKQLTIAGVCSRFSAGKSISASKIAKKGLYPVFGGNGLRGYTNSFNFEGECAIIGRQGAYCGNVRYFCGKAYMTEHAIVACANDFNDTHYLSFKFGLMNLGQFAGQSAQPGLSVETLLSINIDVPKLSVQRKAVSLLESLNSKITNNNLITAELDEMAKLIYNYWFVQFDFPDENGRPYKSSGGKMVWNEQLKRTIPEKWECKSLSNISNIVTESITPKDDVLYHHYSIPAFDEAKMPVCVTGNCIDSSKYRVPNNTILVSKLNPQFKRVWLVRNAPENSICSTEFLPFVSTKDADAFLYETLCGNAFYRYMVNSSSSSTGSRKRMPPEMCPVFKIAYPPEEDAVVIKYCDVVRPILQKRVCAFDEMEELKSLRDFLLPMLMNGQVTIREDYGSKEKRVNTPVNRL